MKYRHLFFDLDHTLWDFDSNARESLEEIYTAFGLEAKAIGPFQFFYTTYLTHNALLWSRYEKGYITNEELKWRRMWRTTSEISNSVKPKKEIFEYALNKAKGKIEECIMIGDNLEADILGAQKAGMDTIFANHIYADCNISPTYMIHHLKELENIL